MSDLLSALSQSMGNMTSRFYIAVYGYLAGEYILMLEKADPAFPAFHLPVTYYYHAGAIEKPTL